MGTRPLHLVRAATNPHSSPRCLSRRSSAHPVRITGGSLYLPPCSFSSILALLHWLLYLPFHCPLFHYFRRIPVSLLPGKGCEFSPFIYGAVITDVLTEFKRHKWPAMISLVYEIVAFSSYLSSAAWCLCGSVARRTTKLIRERAISRTWDLPFRHQRKYFVI